MHTFSLYTFPTIIDREASMKRCSIIIHSVSGNCYIIGSYLKEALEKRNVDVRFYRVEDPDLHIWANQEETANDFYEEIIELPVVTPEKLLKSDMIILGCPTRFGNVSAEMKTFLDSTIPMCEDRALEDKFFACFTSCKYSLCEGSRALPCSIGLRATACSTSRSASTATLPPATSPCRE